MAIAYLTSIEKIKYNINRSLNNGSAGATSKDLLHSTDKTLQENSFEVTVIHIGINDVVNNKNSLNTDHMLQNIKNIAQKGKSYDIQKVYIWGLLTTNHLAHDFIEEVN